MTAYRHAETGEEIQVERSAAGLCFQRDGVLVWVTEADLRAEYVKIEAPADDSPQ